MKEYNLPDAGIQYDQEAHRYFRESDGKELHGITGVIGSMLFPDKYAGVDQATMDRAAEYGKGVHNAVEMFYTCGIDDNSQELANYRYLLDMANLHHIECEYIVTDGENFASPIDHVVQDDAGNIYLLDTKTTYGGPDKNYLSWQLSIYADWFEKQTGYKVSALYCVWLRKDKFGFEPINRLDGEKVATLFRDYMAGVPSTQDAVQVPAECVALADAIEEITRRQKEYDDQVADLKTKLLELMKKNNCDHVEIDGRVLITYVAPTTRESLDSKKLKADAPEIYAQYAKTSPVKESLKITIR